MTHVLCFLQMTQKQFIDAVRRSDVHKLAKLTGKGLDPNFQDTETGGVCSHVITLSVDGEQNLPSVL